MGLILFIAGLAITLVFLVALAIERKSGRAQNSLHNRRYRIAVITASLLGPAIMMAGLYFWGQDWGLNIWIWLGLVLVVSTIGFLVAVWFIGSFRRVIRGVRIINTMIAIEIFGLFMMMLALLIFFVFTDGFAIAEGLMILGLLCAIPAAIYLIVYFAHQVFEKDRPLENKKQHQTYINPDSQHELPTEFFAEDEVEVVEEEKEIEPEPKPEQVIEEVVEEEKDESLIGRHSDEEFENLATKVTELEGELSQKQSLTLLAQEKRKEKADEKKLLLSKENVAKKIRKYFQEVSACFMTDHDKYKIKHGISPYSRVEVKTDQESGRKTVTYSMNSAGNRIHKFGETLVDVERFIAHPDLMPAFSALVAEGVSLMLISEKINVLFKPHKTEFVKYYKEKSDFDNLMILVSHNLLLSKLNLNQVFSDYRNQDVIEYLSQVDKEPAFQEAFPNWAELGYNNIYQAMVFALKNKVKSELSDEEINTLLQKEGDKLAKAIAKQTKKNLKEKK